ncbi:MAG: lipoprotein [Chromatiales bacterium]|jgi:predicted small lipoprotein YifL
MQAWSRAVLYLCTVCLIAGGLLSACGQKGPLYLPEPEPEQDEQVDDQ